MVGKMLIIRKIQDFLNETQVSKFGNKKLKGTAGRNSDKIRDRL
jgi:hypothetical protein